MADLFSIGFDTLPGSRASQRPNLKQKVIEEIRRFRFRIGSRKSLPRRHINALDNDRCLKFYRSRGARSLRLSPS